MRRQTHGARANKTGEIGEKGWWAGEKKNGWFAAHFVLDSRPPAASRTREDERGNV